MTTIPNQEKALGVDLYAKYQPYVNFKTLRSGGVSFCTAKAWDGNWSIPADVETTIKYCKLREWREEAYKNDIAFGIYGWFAPFNSIAKNTDTLLEIQRRIQPDYLAGDFEQYGIDYTNKLPKIDPDLMTTRTNEYMAALAGTGLPAWFYSSPGFIGTAYNTARFPKLMAKYLKWWAQYFKAAGTDEKICTYWDKIRQYPAYIDPLVNEYLKTEERYWEVWQWIGRLFYLPGVYENQAQTIMASVDLNYYNGTEAELRANLKLGAITPQDPQPSQPPEPEYQLIDEKLQLAGVCEWPGPGNLRVRTAPSLTAQVVAYIPAGGKKIPVLLLKTLDSQNQWLMIGYNQWAAKMVNGQPYLVFTAYDD